MRRESRRTIPLDIVNVGIASFAHMHAVSYLDELVKREDVRVVGGWDDNRERAESVLAAYGLPFFEQFSSLLASGVDAVIICSENVFHAELTIAAALAGKHILCEKPLGTTIHDMNEMIQVCRGRGVQLMTAFPCRYFSAVREAKAAVDRGDIGTILSIKGTNRGTMPGGWFVDPSKSGGGSVLDHTVHVLDLMRWFLKDEPKTVYAEMGLLFQEELAVEDAGMVHVAFHGGQTAVLDTSWSRGKGFPAWGDVTMEILGTDGMISIDALAQKNELYCNESTHAQWSYWGDNTDEALIADFVQALKSGKAAPISGEDGLAAAAVALAAYESVKQGTPISMERAE